MNKSGYYLFLILVPLANLLIPYWLAGMKGNEKENQYGPQDIGINIRKTILG